MRWESRHIAEKIYRILRVETKTMFIRYLLDPM